MSNNSNVDIDLQIESIESARDELKKHFGKYYELGALTHTLPLLEELKMLRDEKRNRCNDCAGCTQWKCDCSNIRNNAIDEVIEKVKGIYAFTILEEEQINQISEQLKECEPIE